MIRCIMERCSARGLACLASTCTNLRHLALQVRLPPVVLRCTDSPRVLRWLWSPSIAPRVHTLVARRCLYDSAEWTALLCGLRSVTFAFCRIRSDVVRFLPQSLVHLDMHQVLPPARVTHGTLSFHRLRCLRSLVLVMSKRWEALFVSRLPRGLRRLHLRGSKALILESFMPRGLRDVKLSASTLLLSSNRLPCKVRRLALECERSSVWIRDMLPLDLRRLEHLCIRSPTTSWLPRLEEMTRLHTLHIHSNSFVSNWNTLGQLEHLADLEIRTKEWLGFADSRWPVNSPMPKRMVVSIGDISVLAPHVCGGGGPFA